MLCGETNRYYLQNQEKYVTGSKGLKWSDVTVAEMKNFCIVFFSIICSRRVMIEQISTCLIILS